MRPSPVHEIGHKAFSWTDKLALAAGAAIAGSLKANAAEVWPPLQTTLAFSQANAWWMVFAASGVSAGARAGRHLMGDAWAWKTIQKLLDDYQKEGFSYPDPPHEHRVTLFKRSSFAPWHWLCNCRSLYPRPPWAGWIYPIARSGHTNRKSKTCFLAPDDAQHAEGIAGTAWAQNQTVTISDLPEITNASSDADVETYATATYVKAEVVRARLQRGKATARSYAAIPIERLGERWGVLLLDSTHADGIKDPTRLRIAKIAFMIGKVLERT